MSPASGASTSRVCWRPSSAARTSASKRPRSLSATTAKIEFFSPSPAPPNRRTKLALLLPILPAPSMVAIATGALLKKRAKRTSASRNGSLAVSRARLNTSVREAPGVPSPANATL